MSHSIRLLLILLTFTMLPLSVVDASPTKDSIREHLRARMEVVQQDHQQALRINDTPLLATELLTTYYERRGFEPVWTHSDRPRSRVDQLLTALQRSENQGLRPNDYRGGEIESVLRTLRSRTDQESEVNLRRLTDLELLCTNAFLLYGSHLLEGRLNPNTITPSWSLDRRQSDLLSVLDEGLKSGSVRSALERLRPQQKEYDALVDALDRYRHIADNGGWDLLPEGSTLKQGVQGDHVKTLRERLQATRDLPSKETGNDVFDETLKTAVLHFQERHGLDTDGVVGPSTRRALNVPVDRRVQQIKNNLERWRWLPQNLGTRYVLVNIAAFHLWVIENGEQVLEMRVVTGKPYRQTPVFSDQISYLVFSPYWHVPHSLATRDLLPTFKKDPSRVTKQNFQILQGWGAQARPLDPESIDWSSLSANHFPYRLRQGPGPQNALGQVKFMFPNEHNVYLHDTPTRTHFSLSERSFSSGCIRLERPIDLAEYLLRETPNWSRQRIEQSVGQESEVTAVLNQPVPVHLLYWTAWADTDGTVHFRNDVYQRDTEVESALDASLPSLPQTQLTR